MMRRVPIIATFIVLAAIATMIALGLWQLQRMHWKEALLARYQQSLTMSADAAWPARRADVEQALYRHATVRCDRVLSIGAEAGHNAKGETGWARVARCEIDGAGQADIVLGWSADPRGSSQWGGGEVQGFIGPGRDGEARLIVTPPLEGLQANAAPDPSDIPNNHFSYAVQ